MICIKKINKFFCANYCDGKIYSKKILLRSIKRECKQVHCNLKSATYQSFRAKGCVLFLCSTKCVRNLIAALVFLNSLFKLTLLFLFYILT